MAEPHECRAAFLRRSAKARAALTKAVCRNIQLLRSTISHANLVRLAWH